MKEKIRKQIFFWGKILLAAVFIVIIILKFDLKEAWNKILNTNPLYITASLGAFLTFLIFLTLRWLILSKARKHTYGFFYLFRSLVIHFFFNNILPSTIGGDVYRIVDTGGKKGAGVSFSVVWMDRMSGLIGVFAFGFLASIAYAVMSGKFILTLIFGAAFAVATIIVLAFLSKKINDWLSPRLSKIRIFKYPLGEKIASAFTEITHYRKHKIALFSAILLSLGVQTSLVAIWYLLFLGVIDGNHKINPIDMSSYTTSETDKAPVLSEDSLRIDSKMTDISKPTQENTKNPTFIHFMVTLPVVNTTAMFSVGGWGVREMTFVNILASFSVKVDKHSFLATSFLFDIVNVFFGLIGGALLLLRKRKSKLKKPD